MKWLEEGNDLIIVIYEHITNENLRNETLKDISTFLNFTLNETRLNCTIKNSEGRLHRKEKCIRKRQQRNSPKNHKDKNRQQKNSQKKTAKKFPKNLEVKDGTNNIFTNQQEQQINLAINNVNNAIIKRGLNPLPLSDYENTEIILNMCS